MMPLDPPEADEEWFKKARLRMPSEMTFTEIPSPFPKMRLWIAVAHGFSFAISLEQMQPHDPEWSGYSASWKDTMLDRRPALPGFGGTQTANKIEGGPWKSFTQAEQACRDKLQELKKPRH